MAIRSRDTLKNWFSTGLKPLQSQFWDWIDSFLHKNDKIPSANIDWSADPYNVQSDLGQDDDSAPEYVKNRKLSNLEGDTGHRTVTDSEKETWNGKQDALGYTPENVADKNQANGYPGLDENSKIDPAQLPSLAIMDILSSSQTSLADYIQNEWIDGSIQKGDVVQITDTESTVMLYQLFQNNGSAESDYKQINASKVDWANVLNKPSFAAVSTSGSYNDLSDVPQSFTPESHTHTESEITDLHAKYTDAEAVAAINADTEHGTNAAHNYFSGAYSDLTGKPTTLTDVDANIFGQTAWSTTDIDWSDERVRSKTLTASETWTFSNLKAGKTQSLYITGDYAITLPDSVAIIDGTYDGTVNNLIIFHCIDDTSGAEKVVCQIFNL